MIYDGLGLPKENGADDLEDSARLAGILTVFDINKKIPLDSYLKNKEYTRHPSGSKYDFSRDQAICLLAGLSRQGKFSIIKKEYINGNDILSPSVTGHIKRCHGDKSNTMENLWLWLDVAYHAIITPLEEPNQILCMMLIADKKYLKFWLKINRQWRESIRLYWCGWRKEPELAEDMIKFLEG